VALKVFITGASSGIGEALARHYASAGAQLGLVARRLGMLEKLRAQLDPAPAVYAADVRDAKALADAARDFIARCGTPDLVIANAGISAGTQTGIDDDLAVFRDVIDINVTGLMHTFHPFVAAMRERGAGSLVGIASVAGLRGLPGAAAYSASKAAAISYLESLRVELRGSGVDVTTICPGYIRTPMTDVNRYRMPFIIDADDAARRFARVIAKRRSFAIVPWQMAIVGRILRILPDVLFDTLFSRAPRKPRIEKPT
jgi:short-subunit dehydrogenase